MNLLRIFDQYRQETSNLFVVFIFDTFFVILVIVVQMRNFDFQLREIEISNTIYNKERGNEASRGLG